MSFKSLKLSLDTLFSRELDGKSDQSVPKIKSTHIKKSFLPKASSTQEQRQEQWKLLLVREWASIVGDLSDRITLERIDQNIITVGVFDVHWMQELHILSPVILSMINKNLGNTYVKKLRLKIISPDSVEKKADILCMYPENNECKLKQKRVLGAHEERALAQIKDEELKAVLRRALESRVN